MALTKVDLDKIVKNKATLADKQKAVLDYKESKLGKIGITRAKMAKRAFDILWQEHSNVHIGNRLIEYANTLPAGKVKDRLLLGGQTAIDYPTLCYEDFFDYFNYEVPNADGTYGWYPDVDMLYALLDCFIPWPLAKKFFVQGLKKLYPDVSEDKWL